MRTSHVLAAVLAAGLALGSCTSHFLGSGGRLVIKAGTGSGARAITGSTDIHSATITIDDITDGSSETVLEEPFDWNQIEVDYQLPVGRTYRIHLDIVPNSNAPGYKTGVLRYGDEDVVSLPDEFSAVVVSLNVRPSKTYAFHGRYSSGASTTVNAWTGSAAVQPTFTGSVGTPRDGDQFFYGADGTLYYLNIWDRKVFQWNDLGNPLDTLNQGAKVIDGGSLGAYDLTAVTADSDEPGWFWASANSDGDVYLLWVQADTAGPSAVGTALSTIGPINSEFAPLFAAGPTSLIITGIAQDWVGGLYLSYYATGLDSGGSQVLASGVVQVDPFTGSVLASFPANPVLSGDSDSIARDVTYQSGHVIAAVGPVLNEFSSLNGHGTADIWVFRPGLLPAGDIPSVLARTYGPTVTGDQADFLHRPTRFASGLYRGVLYLEQTGDSSSSSDLTKIDLDQGTAIHIDQSTFPLP